MFFYAWVPLFFLALALIWCVPAALAPVGATFPAAGGGIGGINATVAAVALAPHPLLFLNVVDAAGAQRTPTSTPGVFSTSSVLIITATYLIGEQTTLPVVSLVADPLHLWDPEIGIYVDEGVENRDVGGEAVES